MKLQKSKLPQWCASALCATAISLTLATPAHADAIRLDAGFTANNLPRNDDGSTGLVPLGFTANFFGTNYAGLFVNNNGNVTFNGPLGTFTPFPLLSTNVPIIAPFFADVDTRNLASGIVHYGNSVVNGRAAFGVNWFSTSGLATTGVGYFPSAANLLNTFQLVMIDRSDTGVGNFDFEFNYRDIRWETGGASGGSGGLGGNSARAGYSNGTNTAFELNGSAVNGAFLNGGPNALISGMLNSSEPGRYLFQVRNGAVIAPPGVPEAGGTVALLGGSLAALGLLRRRLARRTT